MKTYIIIYSLLSISFLQLSLALVGNRFGPCSSSNCPPSPPDKNLIFDIGDLDGDGKADYIQRPRTKPATCADDETLLMISDGDNHFTKHYLHCELGLNGEATVLTFGDFDGDGKQEILRRDSGADHAEILVYTGNGGFNRIPIPDFELRSDLTLAHVADFNGDCKDDFLRQETTGWDYDRVKTCHVYMSNGDFTFKKILVDETDDRAYMPGTYTNLYFGDFNHDGKDDILRQEKGTFDDDNINTGTILLSKGDGTFDIKSLPESLSLKGDLTKLHLGDFNGDCITDILRQSVCGGEQPQTSVWRWTDWTTRTLSQPGVAGSASGVLNFGSKVVTVNFEGQVDTNTNVNNGFQYFSNMATFDQGPGANSDVIALAGFSQDFNNGNTPTQTITFSEPVVDPRMAVFSMGMPPNIVVTYDFGDIPFDIVSKGTSLGFVKLDKIDGTKLTGIEGNGVIQFHGTFTSLTFKLMNYEYWHGFQIGAAKLLSDTCPPATVLLADSNADFTTITLPDSYNIEGQYTNLYVGDFNCDRKSDFLKQENGQRTGSDVTKIETFLSVGDTSSYFKNVNLFDSSVVTSSAAPSTLKVADFNGETRSDFMEYWGGNCIEFFYAPKIGTCSSDPCKCSVIRSGTDL